MRRESVPDAVHCTADPLSQHSVQEMDGAGTNYVDKKIVADCDGVGALGRRGYADSSKRN